MPKTPTKTKTIDKPKIIVGEGIDEVNFFTALVDHLNLDDLQVEHCGGKDGLKKYIKEFQEVRPGRDRVGGVSNYP